MKLTKVTSCILLLALCFTLCCCTHESTSLTAEYTRSEAVPVYNFYSNEDITPENYSNFTESYMDFAANMLINATDDENVVLSPLSLYNALCMTAAGTNGKTLKELEKLLGENMSISDINTFIHYLNCRVQSLNSEEGKVTSANSIWINDTYSVKAQFLQTIVNYFDAEVFRTNLSDAKAAEEINRWVSKNTDGEIENLLSDLPDNTAMTLVNTLLFDDEWVTPYGENHIYEGTFNESETACFMQSNEMLIKSSDAKGFVKSYKNTPLKLVAILPNEGVSLDEYVSSLSGSKLETLFESLNGIRRCEAHLPQFELRTKLSLNDTVKAMGCELMFTEDANFDSLTMSKGLSVSDILQESFIKVTPKGTKAGSATAVVVAPGASETVESDFETLVFDRPFLFMIVENECNLPLFIGTVKTLR